MWLHRQYITDDHTHILCYEQGHQHSTCLYTGTHSHLECTTIHLSYLYVFPLLVPITSLAPSDQDQQPRFIRVPVAVYNIMIDQCLQLRVLLFDSRLW